jgi:hypothetical protein
MMNERIKELAVRADLLIKKSNGDEFRYGNFDPKLQKFAELIVQECTDSILGNMDKVHPECGFNVGLERAASSVKQHFGVE